MSFHDIVFNYIRNFDFKEYIESIHKDLVGENYESFAEEFWQVPNANLTKLKMKYSISTSIAFSDILKQYPSDKYINLIQDSWNHDLSINDIIQKYGVPFQKLTQIIFPIPYYTEVWFCPECINSNKFNIENEIKEEKFIVLCTECDSRISNFISTKESQRIKQELEMEMERFGNEIDNIRTNLTEVKCHKCQSELILYPDFQNFKYTIRCTACSASYDNYDNALNEYQAWKQKAAMMIKIKAKEDEMIRELLNRKEPDDIKIKTDDLINNNQSIGTISNLANLESTLDSSEVFIELFKRIKSSSRMAKLILIKICELIEGANNDLSIWTYSDTNKLAVKMSYIELEEPIVPLLQSITKILPVRKILRELIKESLIYCDEETNKLQVHTSLIENLDSIKNLLKPQNINKELSWLIFNKQNFTCYHCGENGRPLKIAFLSVDKDSNYLNNMIGVCDFCFDDVTDDEIYIDLMISGTEEHEKESPVSWNFLITHYKNFKNDDEAYTNNLNLLSVYNEADIIKSYAATIDKFVKENNKGNFFAYAEAILRNSEDGVNINVRIQNSYKVDKWLDKLE